MVKPANGGKPCPEGYVLRKGYTRKVRNEVLAKGYTVRRKRQFYTAKPTKSEVTVGASCAKKKTHSGKGVLRKGLLIKYGYSYRLADSQRKKALESAIKAYGKTSVYNRLRAVVKLASAKEPTVAAVFQMDAEWVKAQPNAAS